MSNYIISNVKVVTPEKVINNGYVYIKNGIIECVEAGGATHNRLKYPVIDGKGKWLIPGIIDIHNDAIEKEIEPRPNALFPLEIALFSLESRLLSHGVTSIYHSLSFIDGDSGVRNSERIVSNIEGINRLKKHGIIRHSIHARYDITEKKFCPILINMIENGNIQLVSFMDHTPGQGQYKKLEEFEKFVAKYRNLDAESVKKLVESRLEKSRDGEILEFIDMLAEKAKKHGIPMASHDDDSPEKIALMKNKGVTISEFPIDIETAEAAAKEGQHIVVGAPNIIRGISNSGNMRAIDAVMRGYAHIICSDYLPSSILQQFFYYI
jgi:alpha-D-ribose 1-methylphosphonate 5-triphosphate diphosphatase